jgi:hypothetical protein
LTGFWWTDRCSGVSITSSLRASARQGQQRVQRHQQVFVLQRARRVQRHQRAPGRPERLTVRVWQERQAPVLPFCHKRKVQL